MQYIADVNGYLLHVSFGGAVECGGDICTEYTGQVPSDYVSLEDWYIKEGDKLYRWTVVDGELTLDSSAVAPVDRLADGYAITAYPTSEFSVGSSSANVPLNGIYNRLSNRFALTDDGGIQCLADGVILLSGVVRMAGLSAGDKIAANYGRYRNGELSTGYDQYASNVSGASLSVTFPPKLLEAQAGDVFYLRAYNVTAARGTVAANSATYLTAQYLRIY